MPPYLVHVDDHSWSILLNGVPDFECVGERFVVEIAALDFALGDVVDGGAVGGKGAALLERGHKAIRSREHTIMSKSMTMLCDAYVLFELQRSLSNLTVAHRGSGTQNRGFQQLLLGGGKSAVMTTAMTHSRSSHPRFVPRCPGCLIFVPSTKEHVVGAGELARESSQIASLVVGLRCDRQLDGALQSQFGM
jgi:hypothetical protein